MLQIVTLLSETVTKKKDRL